MIEFGTALSYVFLAELGDKTQLLALALASRYPIRIVLSGLFLAAMSLHGLSTILGRTVGFFLPPFWINFVAGIAFLGFAWWMLRSEDDHDEDHPASKTGLRAVFQVFVVFFLAELGDKTMITSATMATRSSAWIPVWLGSGLGMFLSDAIAVVIGRYVGKKIPQRPIQIAGAILFGLTGLYFLSIAFYGRQTLSS